MKCRVCGLKESYGEDGLCGDCGGFHSYRWAVANRIWCDYFHRGIIISRYENWCDPEALPEPGRGPE